MITTTNAPCARIMLLRYAKGVVHEIESTRGVAAARAAPAAANLTPEGVQACRQLRASGLLDAFARGVRQLPGGERAVAPVRCYTLFLPCAVGALRR